MHWSEKRRCPQGKLSNTAGGSWECLEECRSRFQKRLTKWTLPENLVVVVARVFGGGYGGFYVYTMGADIYVTPVLTESHPPPPPRWLVLRDVFSY